MTIPCFRTSASPIAPMPRRWPTPGFHITDNHADLLPRIRTEKLRRALYAACERAPLGWETQL